ncbi:hypothetical protein E1301_Tti018621 [Triplophysa tibetana]|uniref:Uncharacterized protein n=1 Tax=Triplophysa tibetana TaxID=1572043 RepID=A0A5A9NY78_9TELE|nr:hypothetical protein E1301_Tti018621 [Triplophysa tibetana]
MFYTETKLTADAVEKVFHVQLSQPVSNDHYEEARKKKLVELWPCSKHKDMLQRKFLLEKYSHSYTELYPPDSKKAEAMTAKMIEIVCIDNQLLSVKEDIGFKRLIAHLESRYQLPRLKYLTNVALPGLYHNVFSHIHSLLHDNVMARTESRQATPEPRRLPNDESYVIGREDVTSGIPSLTRLHSATPSREPLCLASATPPAWVDLNGQLQEQIRAVVFYRLSRYSLHCQRCCIYVSECGLVKCVTLHYLPGSPGGVGTPRHFGLRSATFPSFRDRRTTWEKSGGAGALRPLGATSRRRTDGEGDWASCAGHMGEYRGSPGRCHRHRGSTLVPVAQEAFRVTSVREAWRVQAAPDAFRVSAIR